MTQDWRSTATRQHDCITRAQLRQAGVSDDWITGAVRRGDLIRVGRGIYRLAGSGHSWTGDLWVAVRGGGPYAFAFRRSAAALWDLDGIEPDEIEIGISRGRNVRTSSQVPVHRTTTLRTGDIVVHDAIRVTNPVRTLFDLASLGDPDQLERAAECALRRGLVAEDDLRAHRHPAAPCGGRTWDAVLGRRSPGAPSTESDAETRFVQLCRQAQLPEPVRQHELRSGRLYRLDFAWPAFHLAVEIDGREVHGPDALGADLRRQNRILLEGWLVLRFTFDDIVRYPDETIETLRRAVGLLALRSA